MIVYAAVCVWLWPGPVYYQPGEALGAPDHPHRGFETVSYVIEGGVKHQDSAGNKGKSPAAGKVRRSTANLGRRMWCSQITKI